MKEPRTKSFVQIINALGLSDKKSLFVTPELNKNIVLSSRNIEKTKVITNNEISTYNLMNSEHLVMFESSVSKIESTFK